ncbi:N,N-dimethylformamidase beta subunit family domain-containing protein [Streptomyces shenzhenensis]|uniref:N,N-dimethylformamidase beta subunit-like C-terminal domain-containing protein n=1 Tax=Streptomyces shenzhenensis TaxID=943815 RepID=A0A3M0I030_9ACTN|nr:N,N-dimethylformamidase beta subunit family domain-containing protein [Streptomyces shenzhenensis]RMB82627.1 hypothetical protein CTZ28_28145 [Streptomyces shenzhenensis]
MSMGEEARPVLVPPGVMGYTDRVSYRPGETVRLAVSTTADSWRGELVRLHALAIPSAGVPRRQSPVAGAEVIEAPGIDQVSPVGSYVRVDDVPGIRPAGLVVALAVMPTRVGDGAQTLLSHGGHGGGWWLGLDERGRFALRVTTDAGPVEVTVDSEVRSWCWYELRAGIGGSAGQEVRLVVEQAGTFESNRSVRPAVAAVSASAELPGAPVSSSATLLWGGSHLAPTGPQIPYDGRIESPVLVADATATGGRRELVAHPALLAHWDLAAAITRAGIVRTSRVTDAGPHGLHGAAVNHPQRAVRSSAWDGDVADYRFAPAQYAALHLHRDDMTDCSWRFQGELTLPDELPSGVYGIVLSDTSGGRDTVPVFVAPPADEATSEILVVLPTNSYLAYGNDHVGVDSPRTQVWSQMVPTLDDFELFRDSRRDLGYSLYEAHGDGAGVCYSSWRRPLLTLRERVYDHNAPVWQFTGDMQLIDWLDRTGRAVDVVTDHDLRREGGRLLSRYRVVITGTHPEYPTAQMLDSYESYVANGGRLVYLGGNGMYWVTGHDPEDDQVIEIRRWGGTQAWSADPGEYHLAFTGHLGGPWRFNGRAPQKGFGVGFVAAGNAGASAGYVRVARDPRVDWLFEGVDVDEFGSYGVSRAAAGLEIDSVDPLLGTAPEAIILATSAGHSDDMLEARENFNMTSRVLGGRRNPRVRSDVVLVPRDGGGAVFSTGSIAFAGALYDLGGHTEIGRLFGNVLDRFCGDDPVLDPMP